MQDRMQEFGTRTYGAGAGVRGAMRSDARKRREERQHQERCCEVAEDRHPEEERSSHSTEWFECEKGQ
jgi:hypothetical protein